MYLVLPALFLFASWVRTSWGIIAFWWSAVALWFALGFSTGMLPLSEGGIRSPAEALLKFTRFAPCFLPGIVAYKLWRQPRCFAASMWPVFLAFCCAAFLWFSGSQPIETGWFICFAIGVWLCVSFERCGKIRSRGSPNESLAIPMEFICSTILRFGSAFVVCKKLNLGLRIADLCRGAVVTFRDPLPHRGSASDFCGHSRVSRNSCAMNTCSWSRRPLRCGTRGAKSVQTRWVIVRINQFYETFL